MFRSSFGGAWLCKIHLLIKRWWEEWPRWKILDIIKGQLAVSHSKVHYIVYTYSWISHVYVKLAIVYSTSQKFLCSLTFSVYILCFVVVQSLSRVWLCATPWTVARQAPLSFTISQSLLKPISIELVMPSNHLILCRPLLLLPSVFPSIRVFSSELALCIWWPKYWSFSFSLRPYNEYSGLISFRTDWFDLAVQGILKSLL